MMTDENKLMVGVAREDITPPADTPLAGFGARDHAAEGVHDPLSVTALTLSQDGKKAVILAVDLIGLTLEFFEKIHAHLQSKFGLSPAQVLINFSHTHAGPLIEGRTYARDRDGNLMNPKKEYVESIIPAFTKAIESAFASQKPAKASWGLGETNIGICRRAPDEVYKGSFEYANVDKGEYGIMANYPNPKREIERSVPVIAFQDRDGKMIALLFSAACHPTTMNFSNYLVSAEYPTITREILEKENPGMLSLFIQGMGGDIKPRRVAGETRFKGGTYEDVKAVGEELADDVHKTIKAGLKPLKIDLRYGFKRVRIPLMEFDKDVYKRFSEDDQPEHRKQAAQHWLKKIESGKEIPKTLDMNLSIMELSPDFRFTGVSGELLTFMGWKIKEHLGKETTFPLGYTDGVIAYIPDSSVIRVGGYEVLESPLLGTTRPAPFSEAIDETLLAGYDAILSEM